MYVLWTLYLDGCLQMKRQSTLLDLINGPHLNCVMLPNSGGTWLILLLAKSNVASLLSWDSPATSIRVKQLS
jgi:hypothetical protein